MPGRAEASLPTARDGQPTAVAGTRPPVVDPGHDAWSPAGPGRPVLGLGLALALALAPRLAPTAMLTSTAARPAANDAAPFVEPARAAARAADAAPGRLYLPLLPKGWLSIELPAARATQARRATSTARAALTQTAAAPTTGPTATESPTASPTDAATSTASPTPSDTPSPTATLTPSATPLLGSPTPWPSATPSGEASAPPSPSPSSTGSPTPRAAAAVATERLRPRAVLAPGTPEARFETAGRTYRLRLKDSDGSGGITWRIDPAHPDLARGRLSIEETASDRFPVAGAGLTYRKTTGQLVEPRLFGLVGQVDAVEHALLPADEGVGIRIDVRETLEGRPHRKRYTVKVVGRALELRLQSLDGPVAPGAGGYAGVNAGDVEGTREAVNIRLPGMEAVPLTMLDHHWFAATLLDYPRSQAGALFARGPEVLGDSVANAVDSFYPSDSSGGLRAVDETLWATLSPDPADSFPMVSAPPSPHRAAQTGRVHLTLREGAVPVGFAAQAAYLERLREWGLTDLQVHLPVWAGPAALLPVQGPPDPARGDAAAWARLVRAADGRLAPTLSYTSTTASCPEVFNPRYRPADRVIGGDGLPKPLGSHRCADGADVARYLLAPSAVEAFAREDAAAFRRQGLRAAGLDLMAAYNPGYPWPGPEDTPLDMAPQTQHPASIGQAVAAVKRALLELQTLGPVFGPGAWGTWEQGFASFYAGYLDGVPGSIATGSPDQPGIQGLMVPDYGLRELNARQLPYGMGDYRRFLEDPDGSLAAGRPLTAPELDAYQAATLAFGHAGAWESWGSAAAMDAGQDLLAAAEQVKGYWWGRALAGRLADGPPPTVRYAALDGAALDLPGALAADWNLTAPRLHLVHADGLQLWVNLSREDWPVQLGETPFILPPSGWLAFRAGELLAFSSLVDGVRADYLDAPEVRLRDGRGQDVTLLGETVRDLVLRYPDGRTLREGSDGRLTMTGP